MKKGEKNMVFPMPSEAFFPAFLAIFVLMQIQNKSVIDR